MLPRYLRTFLLIALVASALSACGKPTASPTAEQQAQVSQEVEQILEALPTADNSPSAAPVKKDIEPFSLPLDTPLPRGVTYASMEWSVTEATIDNTVISLFQSDKRTDAYRAARITLSVKNPLSRYASVGSDVLRLRMGDGKLYKADDSHPLDLPEGNAESESHLVFRVPADATWKGAALVFSEAHKEPSELPLEGPSPKAEFPASLREGASASAQETDYRIVAAALDLDYRGKRVEEGKRYLKMTMRVTFNGKPNLAVTSDNFRLLIDGDPVAPIDSMMEVVDANSSKEGNVVFEVPSSASSVVLQVGEAGDGETGKIPLDLASATASR